MPLRNRNGNVLLLNNKMPDIRRKTGELLRYNYAEIISDL